MINQARQATLNLIKLTRASSPEILTVVAVGGVITTAILAAKGGMEAEKILHQDYIRADGEELVRRGQETKRERIEREVRLVWKAYLPAAGSVVLTSGAIIALQTVSAKRLGAATTAYALSEKAFTAYKEKVIETIGEGKERKIRDEIAQESVKGSPALVIVDSGESLCYETYTGRYFRSSMENLRRALNETNRMIISDVYVTLDEFYYLLGIPQTDTSNGVGWTSDRLLDLEFSSVLTPDGKPCIAFTYNYVKPI